MFEILCANKLRLLFFSIAFLFIPDFVCAGDCHIIAYPDHDEVVCGPPPSLQPTSPVPPHSKPSKIHPDSKTPERKAAIKSLIRLSSQYKTGMSYRDLSNLLAEAKTETSIYENSAKGLSKADDNLITLLFTAFTDYDLALDSWSLCNKGYSKMCSERDEWLEKGTKQVQEVLDFYNETWE